MHAFNSFTALEKEALPSTRAYSTLAMFVQAIRMDNYPFHAVTGN